MEAQMSYKLEEKETMLTDIYFINGKDDVKDRVEIYKKGEGLQRDVKEVPQLTNLSAGTDVAVARFLQVESEEGKKPVETFFNFKIQMTSKKNLSAFLTIQNGINLQIKDQSGKAMQTEVYTGPINDDGPVSQKMLYLLIDTTFSMEPYVKNLSQNLGKVIAEI